MFTLVFWKATFERAVKTFGQSLVSVGLIGATGILGIDWGNALSVAGLAALVSVITSLISGKASGKGPSLANERIEP